MKIEKARRILKKYSICFPSSSYVSISFWPLFLWMMVGFAVVLLICLDVWSVISFFVEGISLLCLFLTFLFQRASNDISHLDH